MFLFEKAIVLLILLVIISPILLFMRQTAYERHKTLATLLSEERGRLHTYRRFLYAHEEKHIGLRLDNASLLLSIRPFAGRLDEAADDLIVAADVIGRVEARLEELQQRQKEADNRHRRTDWVLRPSALAA